MLNKNPDNIVFEFKDKESHPNFPDACLRPEVYLDEREQKWAKVYEKVLKHKDM